MKRRLGYFPPKPQGKRIDLDGAYRALQLVIFFLTFGLTKSNLVSQVSKESDLKSQKSQAIQNRFLGSMKMVQSKRYWPAKLGLRFIPGMSGQAFRALLNSLFESKNLALVDGKKTDSQLRSYLEVGTWKGSTFSSAIYSNEIRATCVDNWSQYGGPSSVALLNIGKRVDGESRVSILNQDFREVHFECLDKEPLDVFFFDGPHTRRDHFDGTKIIAKLQFDSLLFIVDDWNDEAVRTGTLEALNGLECGARVVFSHEIFTSFRAKLFSRWHNGYSFFILERP